MCLIPIALSSTSKGLNGDLNLYKHELVAIKRKQKEKKLRGLEVYKSPSKFV